MKDIWWILLPFAVNTLITGITVLIKDCLLKSAIRLPSKPEDKKKTEIIESLKYGYIYQPPINSRAWPGATLIYERDEPEIFFPHKAGTIVSVPESIRARPQPRKLTENCSRCGAAPTSAAPNCEYCGSLR